MSDQENGDGDGTKGQRAFPTTRWTRVMSLRGDDEDAAQEAMAEICRIYWYPIYAFIRHRGNSAHDAEDLTQGFFSHIIEKKQLDRADRERGKLRSFLLLVAKSYMSDEYKKSSAQKRGGGIADISIDAEEAERRYSVEPVDSLTPEKLFERHWALSLLDQVTASLKQEYVSRNKGAQFEVLSRYLSWNSGEASYKEAAAEAELSEEAMRAAVSRMRKRYRVLLRDTIADTINTEEDDVDEEIRALLACIQ